MKRLSAAALTLAAGTAAATTAPELALDWIGPGIGGTSISADGSVIAGNVLFDNSYETFRWIEGDKSYTRLGRATVPVLGTGAGTPDVSDDGTRISATVLNSAGTLATFGLWTDGLGWEVEDDMPLAPDAAPLDNGVASTWGLSGDGQHVTGFYWTSSARARPATWSPTGGAVGLEMPLNNRSARVNASNHDGSVVAGWSEAPTGTWMPSVWVNGALTVLDTTDGGIDEVMGINADGTVLVGESFDTTINTHVATVWRWDGAQWNAQKLGTLPGTAQGVGRSICTGVSADGSVIVGANHFVWSGPFSSGTGFVWTEATGMLNLDTMLADAGLSLPEGYDVFDLVDVSADGTTLLGSAVDGFFLPATFRVRLLTPCPADCDGSGTLNLDDLDCFTTAFLGGGDAADCDDSGTLNLDDIDCFVASFLSGCP